MNLLKRRKIIWRSLTLVLPLTLYFVFGYLASNTQVDRNSSHVFSLIEPLAPSFVEQNNLPKNLAIEKVIVAGFFSDWSNSNPRFELVEVGEGVWEQEFLLPVGEVQYKYVVKFDGDSQLYWMVDPSHPDMTNDSFGGHNSLLHIPDYQWLFNLLQVCSLIFFAFALAFLMIEKALHWLLMKRMPVARKIVYGTLIIAFLSNVMLLLYQVVEYRQFVKQGIVDSIQTFHLSLVQQGADFTDLDDGATIGSMMKALMWGATTRVEKNQDSIMQITLSDVALLTPNYSLVHVQSRQQNSDLQNRRMVQSGFENLQAYFLDGVFSEVIEKAQRTAKFKVLVAHPSEQVIDIETPETFWARQFLGFSNVLVPIEMNGQKFGYYVVAVQVKLYGNEIQRVVAINLLLISIVITLSYLLFSAVGVIFTRNLTRLTNWTQRINSGDFSTTVKINTQDEVQSLAENFAKMQISLKNSFAKISQQNDQLNKAAYTDINTGLGNKVKLLNELSDKLQVHLIVLEIVEYEKLHDFLGEDFTQQMLIEVRNCLLPVLKTNANSAIYKVSASQFAVTINNAHKSLLTTLVENLIESVDQQPITVHQLTLNLTIVSGVCSAELAGGSPALQLEKATQALSIAKSRNERLQLYQPSMLHKRNLAKNISTINRIRDALQKDLLVPYFQPIVDTYTRSIFAFECLARIIEPPNHLFLPNEFLPAAKYSGLYQSVSQTMFGKCAAVCRAQQINITMNLSAMDIENYQSMQFLTFWLNANKDILERITFEITETEKIDDYEAMKSIVDRISDMGGKVALDDFGAGYSNFTHLLSLNIDYIKIDGSLIKNIDKDISAQLITKAIVECAKALNIKTVAEFVHSQGVYEYVSNLGVDYCQGYYFGPPASEPSAT